MYDANGRFTFMIMRSDLPKFASNNRAQATAEEAKAVAQGMIAFYGTYTINEGDKTLAVLVNPSNRNAESDVKEVEGAAEGGRLTQARASDGGAYSNQP